MTFVSYAQNFEDVMLWRALKNVETGFYVDLGAWSPDKDSVTRAFYDRGWRGINIEPNPEFHKQLTKRRPRDITLQVAVGEMEGSLTMNFLSNPGLSTLDDTIAQQHQSAGWVVSRNQVEAKPLARLWHDHVPVGQEVHFLKVDVEGFEEQALRSNDWSRYRPWVVVVEATLPMSQIESHHDWEPILLDACYRFAYADGLNRFYVADEHSELLSAFRYPPNFFDSFLLAQQQEAEARATEAEARATEAEAQATEAEARATEAESRATEAEARVTEAESRATEADVRVARMQSTLAERDGELSTMRMELRDLHQSNHHHWHQWEATKKELEAVHHANHHHWQLAEARNQTLITVYRSLSWRITSPLRFIAGLLIQPRTTLRNSANFSLHCAVETFQQPLSRLMAAVLRQPKLAQRLNQFLMRYPGLHQQLLGVAQRQGIVPVPHYYSAPSQATPEQVNAAPIHLTPRARQIYADLNAAIEKNN